MQHTPATVKARNGIALFLRVVIGLTIKWVELLRPISVRGLTLLGLELLGWHPVLALCRRGRPPAKAANPFHFAGGAGGVFFLRGTGVCFSTCLAMAHSANFVEGSCRFEPDHSVSRL